MGADVKGDAYEGLLEKNAQDTKSGAGLPQLVGQTGRAKSYAERLFEFPEVGPLAPSDARDARVAGFFVRYSASPARLAWDAFVGARSQGNVRCPS